MTKQGATETAPPKPLTAMDKTPPEQDPYATDTLMPRGGGKPAPGSDTAVDPGTTAKPSKPGATARTAKGGTTAGGRTYTVQKGDTLTSIAKKFYNDGSKWKKIWDANKAQVPNKDRLKPGTKLVIPS